MAHEKDKNLRAEKKHERDQAIYEAEAILKEFFPIDTSEVLELKTHALVLDYIGIIELEKGQPLQAIELFKQAFEIAYGINYDYIIIASLNNTAWSYIQLGLYDQALEAIEQKINILPKDGNPKDLLLAYSMKAEVFRSSGNLKSALKFKKMMVDLGERLERPIFISFGLAGVASIYLEMGDFELAKDYFSKSSSLLRQIFGKESQNSYYFTNKALGIISRYEMNYDMSIHYFKLNLENPDLEADNVSTIFELITTLLETDSQEKLEEAKTYLEEINTINKKSPDLQDNIDIYDLSKAMILNKSSRIENKFQAKQLFQKIEKSAVVSKNKLIASQALIEILIYELRASNDLSILEDIKIQIEKLFNLAQDQKRFSVIIDTFFLKSRVELLEGNYQGAFKLLDQAVVFCNEKDLQIFNKRISFEKQKLTEYITIFTDQIKNNPSVIEKIELVKLDDYLQSAKKFISNSIDQKTTSNSKDLF